MTKKDAKIESKKSENDEEKTDKVYKFLIVDDEKEVLDAMSMTLRYSKQFKCEVITVNNGKDALKKLEKKEFDMIISDYKMPEMNGIELLNEVKETYPKTARILVTGYTDITIATDAINKAEVHQYIEKPWDNNTFRETICGVLEKKAKMESKHIADSKDKIRNWLMEMYDDAKGMGLDLSTINHYVESTNCALDSYDWEKALTFATQSVNSMINLAESSNPNLKIKELKNVQIRVDKWNKIDIEVFNDGNIQAKDVKVKISGEFDIKAIEKIPLIGVDENVLLTIEISPKKKGIFPLEIELSCKKSFDNSLVKFEEQFWIQIGDVEGKTKLKRQFGYENGYVKMELNIINEDLRDIKEVNLELLYDDNVLILSNIRPILNKTNKKFKIGDINSCEGKSVIIFFDPLICADTFISGGVSFRDWENNEKYLMLEPQKIRILSPQLSTKNSVSLLDLKTLLEEQLTFNGSKILNIPLGLNIDDSYRTCKELIFKFNARIINEMVEKKPYVIESWFYGITQDSKYQFAIKIRIDEDTNSIELFIASSNNAGLTGLLTDLFSKLNYDLQSRGIIMEPLRPIENMALKNNIIHTRRSLLYKQLIAIDKNLKIDLTERIINNSKDLNKKFENISRQERVHLGKRTDSISKIK